MRIYDTRQSKDIAKRLSALDEQQGIHANFAMCTISASFDIEEMNDEQRLFHYSINELLSKSDFNFCNPGIVFPELNQSDYSDSILLYLCQIIELAPSPTVDNRINCFYLCCDLIEARLSNALFDVLEVDEEVESSDKYRSLVTEGVHAKLSFDLFNVLINNIEQGAKWSIVVQLSREYKNFRLM